MCRYTQICQNTIGGYGCTCPRGYRSQGVGLPCLGMTYAVSVPENEIRWDHFLIYIHLVCLRMTVSCFCLFYTPAQLFCNQSLWLTWPFTWSLFCLLDVDECLQTPNPCAYQCRNVPGSFRCLCPPGTVLLGDGRSCAGLERGQTFTNGTRVRAKLRPQLVSSLGRPILSRSHGVSRITRQSCPVGYTNRDGTCVGEFTNK